jgi:hypothetical protein
MYEIACCFNVGEEGRLARTSAETTIRGVSPGRIRWHTHYLTITGIGVDAMYNREGEFPFRKIFGEAFVGGILERTIEIKRGR